jgi:hypothetical protein
VWQHLDSVDIGGEVAELRPRARHARRQRRRLRASAFRARSGIGSAPGPGGNTIAPGYMPVPQEPRTNQDPGNRERRLNTAHRERRLEKSRVSPTGTESYGRARVQGGVGGGGERSQQGRLDCLDCCTRPPSLCTRGWRAPEGLHQTGRPRSTGGGEYLFRGGPHLARLPISQSPRVLKHPTVHCTPRLPHLV